MIASVGFLLISAGASLVQDGDALRFAGSDAGLPLARYAFGQVARYDPDRSTVMTYTSAGAPLLRRTIDLEGVSHFQIDSVATGPRGTVAVSGAAYSGDGKAVPAIVWLDALGAIQKVVRLSGYAAVTIAFARDGKLWTIGRAFTSSNRSLPGANILHIYDTNGELAAEAVSVETLAARHARFEPYQAAVLSVSGRGMLLLMPTARELMELSLDGTVLRRWRTPEFPPDCFASFMGLGDERTLLILAGNGELTRRLYAFDLDGSTWDTVSSSTPLSYLLGGEANRLLFAVHDNTFAWFTLRNSE